MSVDYIDLGHEGTTYIEISIDDWNVKMVGLSNGTARIVLYHNHPVGGNTVYSQDDLDFTLRLGNMLLLHGITIYEHFIINEYGEVYGMRANGVLSELDKRQAELMRSK